MFTASRLSSVPVLGSTTFVRGIAIGILAACVQSNAFCDDPVFSGPQPGEKLTEFKLLGVNAPSAGKEFDPIAVADGKPTLLVVVHKLSRPGIGLARGLTSYAKTLEDVPSYAAIAWLAEDKAKAEQKLRQILNAVKIEVPVGISIDGGEGPGAYGLNRNVELTILVANENKVVANFALIQPSLTDGVKIAGEFAKALGKTPPTAEELQKIAYPGQRMDMRKRGRRPAARGAKREATKEEKS